MPIEVPLVNFFVQYISIHPYLFRVMKRWDVFPWSCLYFPLEQLLYDTLHNICQILKYFLFLQAEVLEVVSSGYRSVSDEEIKRYTDFMMWFSNVAKSACPHSKDGRLIYSCWRLQYFSCFDWYEDMIYKISVMVQ